MITKWHHEVTTGPAAEPLSTAEAKAHLRVDVTDDDTLIDEMVKAAREDVEGYLSRALIAQTHTLKLPRFPGDHSAIQLPRPPLISVTSITYIDTAGASQTWDSSLYTVSTTAHPGRVYPIYGGSYPSTQATPDAVTIVYTCGYGAASTDIPSDILHAVRLMVANFYDTRGPIAFASPQVIPLNYRWLLDKHRILFTDVFKDASG